VHVLEFCNFFTVKWNGSIQGNAGLNKFEKFNFVPALKRQFEGKVTLATVLTF